MIYFVSNYKVEGVENYATIEDVYEYCKDKTELGIDTETTFANPRNTFKNENIYQPGLDPYLSKVIMLQLGDLDNIFVIDTRVIDISILKPLLEDKNILYCGHNLKFEAKMLKYHYGVNFRRIYDTMIVEMVLTNGLQLGYSLAKLAERYLGIKNVTDKDLFSSEEVDEEAVVYINKSTRLGFLHIGNAPFTKVQILYGADDIEYPLQIKAIQEKGKGDFNPTKLHILENEFCLVLADIELKGLSFDPNQWLKVAAEKKIVYNRRLKALNDYVIANYSDFTKGPDLFNQDMREFICDIQWSSSDQVVKFFRRLGWCPKEKSKQTKHMEYSVGAKVLAKLLSKAYKDFFMDEVERPILVTEDLILAYLLYKRSEQAITTFGVDFLKYVHPITGRLHTSYRQILNTGRISSSNPNLQNIPQAKEYRMAFNAPEGKILIDCDYSSQESRNLAEVSGDQTMLDFFNLGDPIFGSDYHSMVATKMFRIIRNDPNLICLKKTHPAERDAAKSIGFKLAYGASAYTLKDDFGVTEEVAEEFLDGYFNAFPSLREDFEKAKAKAVELGYIEMDKITHRRWFFKEFEHMNSLPAKAWKFYPDNYRQLTPGQKIDVKEKLKYEHPELHEIWSEYFSLKGKLSRDALNYRIQSLAASQMKMAGIIFRRHILNNNIEKVMYLTSLIHDEMIAECDLDQQDECSLQVQKCMIDGGNKFCSKVKMEATPVITSFWYH